MDWLLAEILTEVTPELLVGSVELQIAIAAALLLLAGFFLFLELIIVSFGFLGLLSFCTAALGCYLSYQIGPVAFWCNIAATPVVAIFTIKLGLSRLQQSDVIAHSSIDEDAGYEQVAAERGIAVGSTGTLSTDAMPSGRGKFELGEIDVILQSGSGNKGDAIKVIKINGPSIYVIKL